MGLEMVMTEKLLTVETVAERLHVHPETVRRWLRKGEIEGIRLGKSRLGWRIRASELDRFLQQRTSEISE
jgi:excisionase family DNA binding protein